MRRGRWVSSGRKARGIAEIVGTLMLILIVVAAAVALAAFVAGYESQYLSEQTTAHDRSLENIQIISVDPIANSTPGADNYSSVSAVLGSLDVQNTTITEVTLNGIPLAYYTVKILGGQGAFEVCSGCNESGTTSTFWLEPDQQATLNFSLFTWIHTRSPLGGVYTPYNLAFDHFITLGVYTYLGNDFTRSFYPPTAVVQLGTTTEYVGSGEEEDFLVLNGASSTAPSNTTAVWWSWSFSPMTALLNSTYPGAPLGEEILTPQSDFPTCTSPDLSWNCPESYNITLTVQDSDGLFGTMSIGYDGFPST